MDKNTVVSGEISIHCHNNFHSTGGADVIQETKYLLMITSEVEIYVNTEQKCLLIQGLPLLSPIECTQVS